MMLGSARQALLVCFLAGSVPGRSQVVVPFISNVDRSMVFHGGRFMEVDARPPEQAFAMEGALFFQDHDGHLRYYTVEARRSALIERGAVDELQVAGERAAWRIADSLKVLRAGSGALAATGVERFRVTDSLLVFLDSAEHELAVFWKGRRYPIATVIKGSDGVQWSQGGNTVTFHDRSKRAVSIFHRGILRTLTDSTDVGLVVNGTDIVGYWDDVRQEFMGEALAPPRKLSGMKPVSAQAGDGILAFVDGTLKLSCWTGGGVIQLTDSMPAQYWVKDRLLLYLWRGGLMMCTGEGPMVVEPYVPEYWQVEGDLLVYLDINRELRGIRNGQRLRFGKEASIDGFQLFGDAIVYRSPAGPITVISDGRTYTF